MVHFAQMYMAIESASGRHMHETVKKFDFADSKHCPDRYTSSYCMFSLSKVERF